MDGEQAERPLITHSPELENRIKALGHKLEADTTV